MRPAGTAVESWQVRVTAAALALALAAGSLGIEPLAAQRVALGEVVKSLQHPEVEIRVSAVRILRDAGNPDVLAALAPLLSDPADEVQLEVIQAMLALLLVEPVKGRRRVALVVEVRGPSDAEAAFVAGPMAIRPINIPPEVVTGLGAAILDSHTRVRSEAIYLLGAIARPPLAAAVVQGLLDGILHPEPVVRLAAIRVGGRLMVQSAGESLIYAINDPFEAVRLAAMRSLGELREERSVQALREQFEYYRTGRQAEAAFDGLARIAHASLLPLFDSVARTGNPGLRRIAFEGLARAASPSAAGDIETGINPGTGRPVTLARAFALQKLGRPYLGEIVQALGDRRVAQQARGYLIELGPPIAAPLQTYLHDSTAEVRAEVAGILSLIGTPTLIAQIDPLRGDPEPEVAAAADLAIRRLQLGTKN